MADKPPTTSEGEADAAPAVELVGLRKSYGSVVALDGLDLTVGLGEVFALLGPNGAGKTTALEIMEGYRRADAGRVCVLGLHPVEDHAELVRSVGVVLQSAGFDRYLTVRESLEQRARWYEDPADLDHVLDQLEFTDHQHKRCRVLSGGQQRKLDLALALVGRPTLIFLDEPTVGFDPLARSDAWSLVEGLRDGGTTILLTTHYLDEAAYLSDRIAVIQSGRTAASWTAEELNTNEAWIEFAHLDDLPLSGAGFDYEVAAGIVRVDAAKLRSTLQQVVDWAVEYEVDVEDLTVRRPTLEQRYREVIG